MHWQGRSSRRFVFDNSFDDHDQFCQKLMCLRKVTVSTVSIILMLLYVCARKVLTKSTQPARWPDSEASADSKSESNLRPGSDSDSATMARAWSCRRPRLRRLSGAAAGNFAHRYIGKVLLFITCQSWLYQAAPPGAAQRARGIAQAVTITSSAAAGSGKEAWEANVNI